MSVPRRALLGASVAVGALAVASTKAAAQPDSINLPSSPLVDKANELIDRHLSPNLRNHSVRGFLFGRALAGQRGLLPGADYDEELMYLICVLHDIGLAEIANGDQRFELDGADYAATFLERNGVTDARVDIVWDAIAGHTSGLFSSPVFLRRRPPEIWIGVEGIGIDVGGGPGDVPPGVADAVHAAYPRLGGTGELARSIEEQALAKPQKAPPATLPGELVHQRHPELPYATWDTLTAGGWDD